MKWTSASWVILVTFCLFTLDPTSGAAKRDIDKTHHKARLTNKAKSPTKTIYSYILNLDKRDWCDHVKKTLKKRHLASKRLYHVMEAVTKDKDLDMEERVFHMNRFKAFQSEINETEIMIMDSLQWLDDVLSGDYRNIINMRKSSQERLDALHDATIREEQEFNAIVKAEEKLKQYNETKVAGIIDEILADVAKAADQLESDLNEHAFDNAVDNVQLKEKMADQVEAVVRLNDDHEPLKKSRNGTSTQKAPDDGLIKLVDVKENQFVLSKSKDTTTPLEDHHLIKDLLMLIIACWILGAWCSLAGLPSMFGYILGGLVLGPSGLNLLKSLVQIETIGEFGVFFILFCVGLEFSPDKIKKVWKVSVMGSFLMMFLMTLCGLLVGGFLKAQPAESAFVAASLSLSSTPLVVNFLNPSSQQGDGPGSTEYGTILLGILVMQDVMLGIIVALLPSMAASVAAPSESSANSSMYGILILKLIGALIAMVILCLLVSKLILGRLYKILTKIGDNEFMLMTTISIVFLTLSLTHWLDISMELGCFMAGVMFSAQGSQLAHKLESLVTPVKDFLASIFFASIGLHVFPSFLAYELTYLTTFTILVVGSKFIIGVLVLALTIKDGSSSTKWVVAAGLSQVSEFSFVLGSRARRLHLISREVYLLILSVTTLSLMMAPAVWKICLWQLRIRPAPRSPSSSRSSTPDLTSPVSRSPTKEKVEPLLAPPSSSSSMSSSVEDEGFIVVTPSESKRRKLISQ